MPEKTAGFLEVAERLKMALDISSDVKLAAALGLKQSTWSTSKTRGTLPIGAINALIEREGLNPEFIYKGTGRVMVEEDGHTWHDGFIKRLQQLTLETVEGLLVREGHTAKDIQAVAAGKKQPNMELLRDWRRISNVDLNWVISGDLPQGPTEEEQALLMLYRKATPERQKDLLASLVIESTRSTPSKVNQKAGKQSLQVAGNLATGSLSLGNTSNTQNEEPQGRKTTGR